MKGFDSGFISPLRRDYVFEVRVNTSSKGFTRGGFIVAVGFSYFFELI